MRFSRCSAGISPSVCTGESAVSADLAYFIEKTRENQLEAELILTDIALESHRRDLAGELVEDLVVKTKGKFKFSLKNP